MENQKNISTVDTAQEPDTLTEQNAAPAIDEGGDTALPGEQAQTETPEPEYNSEPSNVINGIFGEKGETDAPGVEGDNGPEMSAEEAAILSGEHEKALHDIGEEQFEPPAPFDISGDFSHSFDDTHDENTEAPGVDSKIPEPDKAEDPAPPAPEDKASEPEKKGRGGKPPKADKADKPAKEPKLEKTPKTEKAPKEPKQEKSDAADGADSKAQAAPEKEKAPAQQDIYRLRKNEKIVFIDHSELFPPKNHPFGVRDDNEMKSLVNSVRDIGVTQPALVRPREEGGYELVCGNRRQHANELAGYTKLPCIVRVMTDDEAVLAMTDDNLRQRSDILPSEKAASLKMQFEAIRHQGTRFNGVASGDIGKRSIEIVGERNEMNGKQVQRYIRLNELVPDLLTAIDSGKLGFTSAVEVSFISKENQNLIAVSMDGEQSSPSLSQAQRMRELDGKKLLNGDVIDGILSEQKKEEIKVIISGKELETYFGKGKTPQEMKEQIIKLLEDWSGKEKAIHTPEKKTPDRDK